uniref:Uncharacterized protein n=1 Tax=Anguilla anguilla TaxID=7936 RepID=A0A0E9QGJ1_ANGAN
MIPKNFTLTSSPHPSPEQLLYTTVNWPGWSALTADFLSF